MHATKRLSRIMLGRTLLLIALMALLCVIIAAVALPYAYAAEPFKIDDSSYAMQTYVDKARTQGASHIRVSVDQRDVKQVVLDWKVDVFEGYRKDFFNDGPYLATIGKKGFPGQVTFKTGSVIAVKSLKFYTDDPVIIEAGTTANFDGCTFKHAPIIRGIANFNNCVFEDGKVVFEGGQATYTGTTVKPIEEGKRSDAHTPLVMKVTPDSAQAVHNRSHSSSHQVELEGSQKDTAEVRVIAEGDAHGLSATYRDGQVIIEGVPREPGTATFVVTAQGKNPQEEQQHKIVVSIEPVVSLELPDNLFVATKYTKKYQQNRKPLIKVGDEKPKELLEYMQQDDRNMPTPEVVTPDGMPTGFRASWLYDSVVISGDEPAPKGVYHVKLRIVTKGQTVESNPMHLRIYDGDETLKQQLAEVYRDELKSPERWEMQPYTIMQADHAVIPTSLKVLMGSDCHNQECEGGNCDARPVTDDDVCPAAAPLGSTDSRRAHDTSENVSHAHEIPVIDSVDVDESRTAHLPDPHVLMGAGSHPWDTITMSSSSGGDGGVDGSNGGAGESGSCWIGVLGTGSKEAYDTDTITIPSGADVTFLNMKIKSSIRIIVEDGAKLTFDDSTTFGVIEVKKGGTFSAMNSSIVNNTIIFHDGSTMDNLNVKSYFNLLSDGYDDRDAPEALVLIDGAVNVTGTNKIIDGLVSRKEKDKDRLCFPALKLNDHAELTLQERSILTVQGGNSEPFVREGGDAILMGHKSSITGAGKLEATGGKGYEDHGGLAVRGPQQPSQAVLKVGVLQLKGGNGETVVGMDSPGNYGISGHVEIVKGCKVDVQGGTGMLADRSAGETLPAFDPAYPDPLNYSGDGGANPNPDPNPNPTPNPDPDPQPTPDPTPNPQPDPDPAPNPTPNPQPTPDPAPDSGTTPQPDGDPSHPAPQPDGRADVPDVPAHPVNPRVDGPAMLHEGHMHNNQALPKTSDLPVYGWLMVGGVSLVLGASMLRFGRLSLQAR